MIVYVRLLNQILEAGNLLNPNLCVKVLMLLLKSIINVSLELKQQQEPHPTLPTIHLFNVMNEIF